MALGCAFVPGDLLGQPTSCEAAAAGADWTLERSTSGCWSVSGSANADSTVCSFEDALAAVTATASSADVTVSIRAPEGAVRGPIVIRHAGPGRLRVLACGMVVEGEAPRGEGLVSVITGAGALEVEGLEIRGSELGLFARAGSGTVAIAGVSVVSASSAVVIDGGEVDLRRVRVAEATTAVVVRAGGRLFANDLEIHGGGDGVVAEVEEGSTEVTLSDGSIAGLTGDAVRLAAAGEAAAVRATLASVATGPASTAGLGGRNGIVLRAEGSATMRARVDRVRIDGAPRAAGNAGAITAIARDQATLELALDGVTVRGVEDAQALRVVADGSQSSRAEGSRLDVSVLGSTFDGVGRQAIFASGRGSGGLLTLQISDNRFGAEVPIGWTGRAAIEIVAEEGSEVRAEVRRNQVAASSRRSILRLGAEGDGRLAVAVNGNTLANEGEGGDLRVATAGAGTVCLALGGNRLGARRPEVAPEGGTIEIESLESLVGSLTLESAFSDRLVGVEAGACGLDSSPAR